MRERGGEGGGCGCELVWGRGGLVGRVGRDGDGVGTCFFFGMFLVKKKTDISNFGIPFYYV